MPRTRCDDDPARTDPEPGAAPPIRAVEDPAHHAHCAAVPRLDLVDETVRIDPRPCCQCSRQVGDVDAQLRPVRAPEVALAAPVATLRVSPGRLERMASARGAFSEEGGGARSHLHRNLADVADALDLFEDRRHRRGRETGQPVLATPLVEHPVRGAEADSAGEHGGATDTPAQHHVDGGAVAEGECEGHSRVAPQMADVFARPVPAILLWRVVAPLFDDDHVLARLGEVCRHDRSGRTGADDNDVRAEFEIPGMVPAPDDLTVHGVTRWRPGVYPVSSAASGCS